MSRNSSKAYSTRVDLDESSYSESGDELDREIFRLEREILEQKMEIVRREEMAKRNRLLDEVQNERQEPKKPVLAELRSAKMMVENSQKTIAMNRVNNESVAQKIAKERDAARHRHSGIESSSPENEQQLKFCVIF